jgi:hypothetical protein
VPAGLTARELEREAQEKLAGLLRRLDAWEVELVEIYATLPAPDRAEAEAMEEGERPESLAHCLRTAIECLRIDGLPPIKALLAAAVATRAQDLEREWCTNQTAELCEEPGGRASRLEKGGIDGIREG